MADDLHNKLQEAEKHFNSGAYEQCAKALVGCPQDDPKVIHNLAIADLLRKGGQVRDALTALKLSGPESVVDPKTKQISQHLSLQFEGQEVAYINQACLLLLTGSVAAARNILLMLARHADSYNSKTRARIAMLLQVTTRRLKGPVADQASSMVSKLLTEEGAGDKLVTAVKMALSDSSGLHQWFQSAKGSSDAVLYLNNLGVEAFADGKPHIAGLYFSKALAACDGLTCIFTINSVVYNNGVCALARNQGGAAATALLAASKTLGNPLLWLRVAQAFLAQHGEQESLAARTSFATQQKQHADLAAEGKVAPFTPVPAMPEATVGSMSLLTAASQALNNAIFMLRDGRSEPVVTVAKRLQASDQLSLWLAVHCHLAYTELCKGNAPVAVKACDDFFAALDALPGALSGTAVAAMRGVMLCYHVEALCQTNQQVAALKILQSVDLGNLIAESVPSATVEALFVNLCVVHIANGSWTKAFSIAASVLSKLSAPHATLLQVYLDLAQGNTAGALDLVEKKPLTPLA